MKQHRPASQRMRDHMGQTLNISAEAPLDHLSLSDLLGQIAYAESPDQPRRTNQLNPDQGTKLQKHKQNIMIRNYKINGCYFKPLYLSMVCQATNCNYTPSTADTLLLGCKSSQLPTVKARKGVLQEAFPTLNYLYSPLYI